MIGYILTYLVILTIVLIGFRINKEPERKYPMFIDMEILDAELKELIDEDFISKN